MQPFTPLNLAPLLTVIAALTAQAKQPNIIFLMSDDQSTYTMGCYGNCDVQTPNLDRLSADGITFDNHYVSTAICMASRATVMTGMYEYKTGCNFQHGDLSQDKWLMSYPVLLREAGYLTAFAGKFGFDIIDGPNGKRLPMPEHDFDFWGGGEGQTKYNTMANASMKEYADEYPHSTLSYGAFGRDFIAQAALADQPFCLSISFKAPHKPATPDPQFDAIYAGKTFIRPANYGRENGKHFSKQSRQDRQYERFESWGYADRYDEVMAIYHQQIYAIDVAIGMIRDALNAQGIADNTVIIYTSDNGFFCGSHGYGSKVLPYQESTKVPLIVYDPRHTNSGKQLRSDALTANIDFTPTILSLAGLHVPENMDGTDLMPLYKDPTADIHETIALINVWGNPATHALAVVTKDMKYIHWPYAAEGFEASDELYDLSKDPHELVNQADNPEYAAAMEQMRQHYDEQLANWTKEAVSYNEYQSYSTAFDRTVEWADKSDAFLKGQSSSKTKSRIIKQNEPRHD